MLLNPIVNVFLFLLLAGCTGAIIAYAQPGPFPTKPVDPKATKAADTKATKLDPGKVYLLVGSTLGKPRDLITSAEFFGDPVDMKLADKYTMTVKEGMALPTDTFFLQQTIMRFQDMSSMGGNHPTYGVFCSTKPPKGTICKKVDRLGVVKIDIKGYVGPMHPDLQKDLNFTLYVATLEKGGGKP